mmetsp:Transcript_87258/g.169051  ORF Transcript_87258/g.169051 Transcript_87258/m.169051 type:complete len:215 (-) Transcript_87258:861-1505(-)
MRARGAVAPFCVTDLAVSAPCRVKRASDQAKRKKARVQASELAVIQAAEREERQRLNKAQARAAAALEWVDLCTEALATIRSGGYLRMAPCAPKHTQRSFYDEELVPASEESSGAQALGTYRKLGQAARYFLLEGNPSSSSSGSSPLSSPPPPSSLPPLLQMLPLSLAISLPPRKKLCQPVALARPFQVNRSAEGAMLRWPPLSLPVSLKTPTP